MRNPEGESDHGPLRPLFDRRLKLEFHGSRFNSLSRRSARNPRAEQQSKGPRYAIRKGRAPLTVSLQSERMTWSSTRSSTDKAPESR